MDPVDALLARLAARRERAGRPWVTLSYAQSLDGSIAARPGHPLPLSGHQSMTLTHRLRAAHDAILVGIGTVLADDPRLTVRLAEGRDPQPVVVDSQLRTPLESNLMQRSPWIATTGRANPQRQAALESAGARVLRLPADGNAHVNLAALLDCLGDLGIRSVMVEGGAGIITSFLGARLVDLLVLTVAPLLVGGLRGVGDLGVVSSRLPHLRDVTYQQLGGDLIVCGELDWGAT